MTLGGIMFVKDGVKFDYCFQETIHCLQAFCDKVVILDAGSTDRTVGYIKQYEDQNTMVVCLDNQEWDKQQGREKLSYFQNLALSFLDTDYYFLLQADEILHENCFPEVRKAIETDSEAFYCSRINLWRDCNSYINTEAEKQPCSINVIRLAKTKYKSVDDGESIEAMADVSFLNKIRIFHMGFVRDKNIMKSKIINMQESVFNLGYHDPKLDKNEVFNSELWFTGEELRPIEEPLPKFIKEWASTRP